MDYIDVFEQCDLSLPFHIMQGARGTGKTWSALTGALNLKDNYHLNERFVLFRRTQDECEAIASPDSMLNPFKKINQKYEMDFSVKKINKKVFGCFYDSDCDSRGLLGYVMALSMIAHIRGADFSDVGLGIGDEFVPEPHVRMLADEGGAWFNAYETIARNREMEGLPPMQMFWLSNSNNIYNPLLSELGIIDDIEVVAKERGKGVLKYEDRGLEFHLLETPPRFKEAKAQTAIGKLTKGTKFSAMALDNKYAFNDFSLTGKRNLRKCYPIFSIDDVYVYKHPDGWMYACYAQGDVIERYQKDNIHDQIAIRRRWRNDFVDYYTRGKFFFATYAIKHDFLKVMLDLK